MSEITQNRVYTDEELAEMGVPEHYYDAARNRLSLGHDILALIPVQASHRPDFEMPGLGDTGHHARSSSSEGLFPGHYGFDTEL